MNITSVIRQCAEHQRLAGLVQTVLYTWPAKANVLTGTAAMPVCFVELPRTIRLNIDRPSATEVGRFNIYYLTSQPAIDFDGASNEVLVDAMIDHALDMVGLLRASMAVHIDAVEVEGGIIYDAGDRNLTGVKLALDLSDLVGHCVPSYKRTL